MVKGNASRRDHYFSLRSLADTRIRRLLLYSSDPVIRRVIVGLDRDMQWLHIKIDPLKYWENAVSVPFIICGCAAD